MSDEPKIFGYVPANENTGLECSAINNDQVVLGRFEFLPIYGNLKVWIRMRLFHSNRLMLVN